jgi:PTS system mannose-specific IIA component
MASTLILTHGGLASELVEAAAVILGKRPEFEALSLSWSGTFEESAEETRRALENLDSEEGVLILTDIYGGTPYNVAASFYKAGEIEVVAGVNLPMVVRLGCPGVNEMELTELASWIQTKARGAICRAGESRREDDTCDSALPPSAMKEDS